LICKIVLHSILRELLTPETHGRVVWELPEGSTVLYVSKQLKIPEPFLFSINGEVDHNKTRYIQDGDEIHFFRPTTGG
jgi:hypothetical protein